MTVAMYYQRAGVSTYLRQALAWACLARPRCFVAPRLTSLANSRNAAALCRSAVVARRISFCSHATMSCLPVSGMGLGRWAAQQYYSLSWPRSKAATLLSYHAYLASCQVGPEAASAKGGMPPSHLASAASITLLRRAFHSSSCPWRTSRRTSSCTTAAKRT